jgi:two-component system phosphate regulon sensor histidine kinase PhoR
MEDLQPVQAKREYDNDAHSVLVVDDEKRIRQVCRTLLLQEGFAVELAADAQEGLRAIEKKHFDIILLDLMMPGISGLEALPELRRRHPDSVVIVITGYATIEHSIEAMKKGAFDFIPKPFSPRDLRVVISRALEFIHTLKDIRNERSRIRTLVNHLGDGVLATDLKKKIALANPAFYRLMGFQEKPLTGCDVDEVVCNRKLSAMIDAAISMPADSISEQVDECVISGSSGGEDRILGIRCVPFRDRLGRTLGTITVFHDITARKKMDQLKSDFVALVAHEIRSPMSSVMMQLKVVMDGLAGEVTPKQSEILQRAGQKIEALVKLSSELLDLSKIESGLITQEREQLHIDGLLAEQVDFHLEKARARNIDLVLEQGEPLPPVMANPTNMEEVLTNLITNAINYSPDGGRVTVSSEIEGDYLCIRVADNGFGIAKEDQDRIFDRFYRVKNEKTRFVIGTGLGLPIVKSILEAHDGGIRVESTPGKGSVFIACLPVYAAESRPDGKDAD